MSYSFAHPDDMILYVSVSMSVHPERGMKLINELKFDYLRVATASKNPNSPVTYMSHVVHNSFVFVCREAK